MADFSLTTLFVIPVTQTSLPNAASVPPTLFGANTNTLSPGQVGFYDNTYTVQTSGTALANASYFYIAQGRDIANRYLQGSKRSDKINASSVSELYKVTGSTTSAVQTTVISDFNVKGGDTLTITLRAHSSYLDTLYFNGFTRSITIQAPCLACGGDPCGDVDVPELIAKIITKFTQQAPGINPDNINFNTLFNFAARGSGQSQTLVITAKPLTKYGQPCDIAAFPFEYDRMYFRTFVYTGPATTADFIVADACNIIATETITQRASYPQGSAEEIAQLEKNFYSYQAGYLKHLYRMNGYNENFESWVSSGTTYDTYYIKFNNVDKSAYQWGDYVHQDSTVIIAVPQGNLITTTTSAAAIAGATQLVLVNRTGLSLGQQVVGTNINPNAQITAITPGSGTAGTITISIPVLTGGVGSGATISFPAISATINTLLTNALGTIADDSAPANTTTSTTTQSQPSPTPSPTTQIP